MRYVLFNWLSPEDLADWQTWTPEQQQADVQRHMEWFAKHRDHIVGGEELDEPRTVKTLRRGQQGEGIVVTDGPYVEAKEILGGFVILEAQSMEQAVQIASQWPSLSSQPNATVQVQPAFVRD
ncbi:MAG: YciI family protein [Chloroflexota bacterium]|nr:YciI family protein [Chloroflexota bacterium]